MPGSIATRRRSTSSTEFASNGGESVAAAAEHPTAAAAASSRLTLECPPELEGLRVLLVEDEPDARDLLIAVVART